MEIENRAARKQREKEELQRESGERISEYFDPRKGETVVRRYELQAILTRYHQGLRAEFMPLRKRAWRAIKESWKELTATTPKEES